MTQAQPGSQTSELRSVFTTSMTEILSKLDISLVISTYQAGKVILVRHDFTDSTGEDGQQVNTINTHFRDFEKPMGITTSGNRLSIGGSRTVWEFRNIPDVARKLEPPGKHDACFLPRSIHITGDIDIHEMDWSIDNELWLVNTRFCCLCTLDIDYSFNPRWRPNFVSALAPEDRCHLNGLAMVNGHPKYVTALGETDTAGGWRRDKASGGVLIDVDSNEILLRGLSMPHSPRWYRDKLWVLESGQGSLAQVDLDAGTWRTVVQLPGFTRGIDFVGPLAFIGLSQVRESATFSGIPLVERLRERTCGVWVVNVETGETVGFLRFESGVQEIFAVQVLHGMHFPEMLEWNDPRIASSYVLPDAALAQVSLPSDEELADLPATHFRRGLEYYRKARLEDAIVAFSDCLARDPDFPNARYNLAVALADADQFDEAIGHLQQVSQKEPERAEVFNSLGTVLARQNQHQQAIAAYQQAISLQTEFADAHCNLAAILLKTGDYGRGWEEYDWRWKTPQYTPLKHSQPRWDGSALADRTLLIHTGHSAGDAIQFARYLPDVVERCAKIIIACRADLVPVFAAIPGISEVREPDHIQVSEFDIYVSLLDLPRIFKTTIDNIPARIPYLHSATIARRKDGARLKLAESEFPRVGIVWAAGSTQNSDPRRSCSLNHIDTLLRIPGLTYYSLQNGDFSQELDQLPAQLKVKNLQGRLGDLGDLVVILEQLDLLISVDTAAAHVAGALGKPVWTLLGYDSDWRWGLETDTTPWYPTMRLFRQKKHGDWPELIERVGSALERWLDKQ